jgi:hypothetical protein
VGAHQSFCKEMHDKLGYIVPAIAVLLLTGIGWCFVTILREKPTTLSEVDIQRIEQDLKDSLEPASPHSSAVVTAIGVSQIRIMPFYPVFSGLSLSPHKIPASLGLAGIVLAMSAFLWCFFVPKTIGVSSGDATRSQGLHEDSMSGESSSVILAPKEDE